MSVASARVPAAIASGVICLGLGILAGGVWVARYGNPFEKKNTEASAGSGPSAMAAPGGGMGPPGGGMGGPGGGMGKGGPGGGMGKGMPGMGKGGPGGPGGGMGGPPGGAANGGPGGGSTSRANTKAKLVDLIVKLDQLTQKSLTIELTPEMKKQIHDHLKGLEDKDDLSNFDADRKLNQLLEVLKDKRSTLEAVGFVWSTGAPGSGPRPPSNAPNPFKDETTGKHLKSLQSLLTKDGK